MGIQCRINHIHINLVPDTSLEISNEETINNFRYQVIAKDIYTTIRVSHGQDIYAASGLLSAKELI